MQDECHECCVHADKTDKQRSIGRWTDVAVQTRYLARNLPQCVDNTGEEFMSCMLKTSLGRQALFHW